jgi:hypothetical protein
LRSQTGISNAGRGGRRYAPYVFTEQGVAMLSGVLRSKRAVTVNIAIMRAFVELHRAAASYAALEKRLEELERDTKAKIGQHDEQLGQIFQALRQLISPPPGRAARSGSGHQKTRTRSNRARSYDVSPLVRSSIGASAEAAQTGDNESAAPRFCHSRIAIVSTMLGRTGARCSSVASVRRGYRQFSRPASLEQA